MTRTFSAAAQGLVRPLVVPRWAPAGALWALTLGLAAAAAATSARQGINHDQLIFYQAGMRSALGQLPYRDYGIPQGPVAGLLFAIFFRLAPTGGYAFIAASALLALAATALAGALVARATHDRPASLTAGLLTAIWFLPVFGSYYNDHLSYVLVLTAVLVSPSDPRRIARWLAAGALFGLAYQTKQTVCLGGGLAYLVCQAIFDRTALRPRPLGGLLAGFAAVQGVLWLYLAATGSGHAYWLSAVVGPLQYAQRSPGKSPWRLWRFLWLPWDLDPVRMIAERGWGRMAFYPLVLVAYAVPAALAIRLPRGAREDRPLKLLAFFWLSTLWAGAWLGRYHGQLFFGMGGAIALAAREAARISGTREAAWYRGAAWLFGVIGAANAALCGPRVLERDPCFDRTDLAPIQMPKGTLTTASCRIVDFLRERPGEIAITGGQTYYVPAALRRPPWNPPIYFEYPLTLPRGEALRAEWQQRFIDALEKHRVRYVVVDRTWPDRETLPELRRYLLTRYRLAYESWPLQVYAGAGPPSPNR